MIEDETHEELNFWEDEGFLSEMESRADNHENGKESTLSLEEFKQKIQNR